ncbi:MAG TPA: FG-GAP-like repeat-containing protein [Bacteroidota bacterium]|nr:FG-GAP-like repeat-containing protein [Bacteroidota bacterium]
MNRLASLLLLMFAGLATAQTFRDVSDSVGLPVPGGLGYAGVWIDYNEDGWPDILGEANTSFVYRNNGNGTFTDVTATSGLAGYAIISESVGDFDNDGWQDLLIGPKVFRNSLGQQYQLHTTFPANIERSVWLDYDGDGWLDVFAVTGSGPRVYRNQAGTAFVDVTGQMTLPTDATITCAAADYDNDGMTDVYLGRFNGLNQLLRNIAGSNFQNMPPSGGFGDPRATVSVAWGDYNADGWQDIYSANIGSNRNVLYRNNGNGTFTDVTMTAGVPDVGDARTATFVDYNNDGRLDLFTTNHVNPNRLYRNNGNGTFTDVAPSSNISSPQDGFGVSWADYDRDGDLDVILVHHESRTIHLLRNDGGNAQNWLFIRLRGVFDNRMGIGARLELFVGAQRLVREMNAGAGSKGQDAYPLHVGLGSASTVDSIVVRWPSGLVHRVYNVAANQQIEIVQQGNVPPRHFRLVAPPNGTVTSDSAIVFRWTRSADPDSGRVLSYVLHLRARSVDTTFGPTTDTTLTVGLRSLITSSDTVLWYVRASDGMDSRRSWDEWQVLYNPVVSVSSGHDLPKSFRLLGNFPNPFSVGSGSAFGGNPGTTIVFEIPNASTVEITLYNMLGQVVRHLLHKPLAVAGRYEVVWDGKDDAAVRVASGVYLIRMKVHDAQGRQHSVDLMSKAIYLR